MLESDPRIIRLLHAYIGMMTEAGELQQQLYGVLFEGKELDVVNCQEEGGDGLWYHGIHSDAVGMPLEDMMGQNNAKLRARFPEKFTDKEADIRDLQAERNVLEGVGTVKDCQITAGTIYSMAQTENLE